MCLSKQQSHGEQRQGEGLAASHNLSLEDIYVMLFMLPVVYCYVHVHIDT